MKKCICLVVLSVLLLTACSSSKEVVNSNTASTTELPSTSTSADIVEVLLDDEIETTSISTESNEEIDPFQGSYCLYIDNILQNPELPTGCEVVSAAIVLNYFGFNVDKCDLADNYLDKGKIGEVSPYEAFLGNPRSNTSYGCYSPVITNCLNKYLSEQDTELRAYDISGTEFEELFDYIKAGYPVITVVTIDLAEPFETTTWNINGEDFTWIAPDHCLVVYGFDTYNSRVFTCDPLIDKVAYELETFKARYNDMGKQAIVVK